MNTLPFQKISIKELAKLIGHNGQIQSMVNVCGFLLCQKGWAKVSVGEKNFTITQGDMYIYAPSSFIHRKKAKNHLLLPKDQIFKMKQLLKNQKNKMQL